MRDTSTTNTAKSNRQRQRHTQVYRHTEIERGKRGNTDRHVYNKHSKIRQTETETHTGLQTQRDRERETWKRRKTPPQLTQRKQIDRDTRRPGDLQRSRVGNVETQTHPHNNNTAQTDKQIETAKDTHTDLETYRNRERKTWTHRQAILIIILMSVFLERLSM